MKISSKIRSNYELKNASLDQLKGNWLVVILVFLVFEFITGSLRSPNGITWSTNLPKTFNLLDLNFSNYNYSSFRINTNFTAIIPLIFTGPLSFGLACFCLKLIRKQEFGFENLAEGFKNFLNTFLLHILKSIFITLWTLLFIIPGIVAIFKYSMAYYILNDNPSLSAYDAITKSKEMMFGHKSELFSLWLSFLGWFILSLLTCGIGLIWAVPYYKVAVTNFYEDLKECTLS